MLAWIFWHTRFAHVEESDYRAALRVFHARIAEERPEGFSRSRTLRYEALPWLPAPTEVYEDWYFVDGSAALDRLEEAALSAFARDQHDSIARLTASATAGLYRLRAGQPLAAPAHCTWMSKPRHEPHEAFIDRVRAAGTVWTRQMVLGPTPEFCVEGASAAGDPLRDVVMHALRPDVVIADNGGGAS